MSDVAETRECVIQAIPRYCSIIDDDTVCFKHSCGIFGHPQATLFSYRDMSWEIWGLEGRGDSIGAREALQMFEYIKENIGDDYKCELPLKFKGAGDE